MKKLLKWYKYILCCLALIIVTIACQQDEDLVQEDNSITYPELSGRIIKVQELLDDKSLAFKINALASPNNAITENGPGITIDTTHIEMMTSTEFTNYTFQVVQDSVEREQLLRNYMITVVRDTIVLQHLISYNVLSDGTYDTDNFMMEQVWGDDLISQTSMECGGSTIVQTSYEDCYEVLCGLSGDHGDGEVCQDGVQRGRIVCVTRWVTIILQEDPCDGSSSSSPGDSGPGPGGSSPGDGSPPSDGSGNTPSDPGDDNNDDDDETAIIGLLPNEGPPLISISEEERTKTRLKKMLEDPVILSEFIRLKGKINSIESGNYREDGAKFVFDPPNQTTFRNPDMINDYSVSYTDAVLPGENLDIHIHQTFFRDKSVQPAVKSSTSPIFSDGDIDSFFANVNEAQNDNPTGSDIPEQYTEMVMTEAGVFALVVDDLQDVIDANTAIENNTDGAVDQFYDDFKKLVFEDSAGISDTDYINRVIDFINNNKVNGQSMGIAIYEASFNSDGSIDKWKKK